MPCPFGHIRPDKDCFPCKLELSRNDLSFPEPRSTVRETTYFQTQDGRLHERVDLSRVHE